MKRILQLFITGKEKKTDGPNIHGNIFGVNV